MDHVGQINVVGGGREAGLGVVTQLLRGGWTPIFQGTRSVVFARRPSAYLAVVGITGPRCRPGP